MCVCLDVNQGGTKRYRCRQRLVILLMNPDCTPKISQCDLLYGSKSPAEKWVWIDSCCSQLSVTVHGLLLFCRCARKILSKTIKKYLSSSELEKQVDFYEIIIQKKLGIMSDEDGWRWRLPSMIFLLFSRRGSDCLSNRWWCFTKITIGRLAVLHLKSAWQLKHLLSGLLTKTRRVVQCVSYPVISYTGF